MCLGEVQIICLHFTYNKCRVKNPNIYHIHISAQGMTIIKLKIKNGSLSVDKKLMKYVYPVFFT
jgi:hypothetical protein